MAKGGARPGAGRPRKVPIITPAERQDVLAAHLGDGWEEKIATMGAKDSLYLLKSIRLLAGELTEAEKINIALLPYEESKPLQQTALTVQGALSSMSLTDMLKLRDQMANSTDAEFTLVTSREGLD